MELALNVGSGLILCMSWFLVESGLLRFLGVVQISYYISNVVLTTKPNGIYYLWTSDMVALELSDGLEDVYLEEEEKQEHQHDAPILLTVPLAVKSPLSPMSPNGRRGSNRRHSHNVPRSLLEAMSLQIQESKQRRFSRMSTTSATSDSSTQSTGTYSSVQHSSVNISSKFDSNSKEEDEYDSSEDEQMALVSDQKGLLVRSLKCGKMLRCLVRI